MGYPRAANRDACLHGHPWPENLARDYRGWAYCAACYRGWHGPAEPDPVAIERAVSGDAPAQLTSRERQAAVLALIARDLSAPQIADRIGCSQRTVHRARSRTAAAA